VQIAYREIESAILQALHTRGLSAPVRLEPIEPPRDWGVTCNVCFTLAGKHAAAEVEAATAGLDKKEAKAVAATLSRKAGLQLAAQVATELEQQRQAGELTDYIARVESEGAYLNFYYDPRAMAELVVEVATLGACCDDEEATKRGSSGAGAPARHSFPESESKDAGTGARATGTLLGSVAFGSNTIPEADRKQIMVEYAQPNTHKDFHVGHLRNASIGQAIANLLEFGGHTVYKATYLGDVGAHVAKAMHGRDLLPRSGREDPLDYWGRAYQAGQDTPTEGLVAWLNRWEEGDPAARQEWQQSRDECVAAFKHIFDELSVDFHPDCWFYESVVDDTQLGQKTAEELKQRGIAMVDESEEYKGALYVDFEQQAHAVRPAGEDGAKNAGTGARATGTPLGGMAEASPVFSEQERKRIRQLGKMTILRSNGTSLYQTKELGLAKYKFDWVKQQTGRELDESLYVVGAEQKLYFEQVFAILQLWGFPNADKCRHIAYELVVLPEGKMSSREGTVVSYRELRDAAVEQAEQVIREKGLITDEAQVRETAKAVAIAAIKYTMLQVSGNQQIVFDFAQALSFDGRAAPYLQYAYARAGKLVPVPVGAELAPPATSEGRVEQAPPLHQSEISLTRLLSQFPETCRSAAARYEPAIVCNYLYAIADAFSAFYRDCRVLDAPEPERGFRQRLVQAFRNVTRSGFAILALPLPEAM
jgi:arginyl-tRNA synthetase